MRDIVKLLDDPSLLSQYTEDCSDDELLELWQNFGEASLQKRYWGLLSPERRAALLLELAEKEQDVLFHHFLESKDSLIEALVALEPDERVDILQHVHPDVALPFLQELPEKERLEAEFLLPFNEEQAAGIMTTRYSVLSSEMTVSEALAFIRSSEELVDLEVFYYHYILDEERVLQGVISLKELLLAADQEFIGKIMIRDVQCVESNTEQEEVMELLEDCDLLAVPVVNKQGQMQGLVTFDDVMDLIRQEQAQNISNLGGVSGQRADLMDNFLQAPFLYLLAQRLPWLIFLLFAGTLTSHLLAHFQGFMLSIPILTLFIPLITQTGGNVGSQSSVLIIRSISARNIHFNNLWRALCKEFFVALALALVIGAVVFLRNKIFLNNLEWQRNMAISFALGAVVLFAALIGVFVPLLLSSIKLDPTVASGPLMATLIDVIGLGLYFIVMKIFIGYF